MKILMSDTDERVKPNTLMYVTSECPPFVLGEVVLFLGYLNGYMEGHGIFVRGDKCKSVLWGYHVEDHFAPVTDELMDNATWDRSAPDMWIVKV